MNDAAGRNRLGHRGVTATDVARLVGVSRSAVSRAFSPGALIAESTRQRVYEAAHQLGYVPNALARMLINQRSRIVGIMMGTLMNPFRSTVLERLTTTLHQTGYLPILFQVRSNSLIEDILPSIQQYQPEAVVVTGLTPTADAVVRMRSAGTTVVVLNRGCESDVPAHFISTDHAGGARLVAIHMVAAGYQKFAVIGAGRAQVTTRSREDGFKAALQDAGLKTQHVIEHGLSYENGHASAVRLMRGQRRPEAVFCLNDMTALGFIDGARSAHGLEPQRDYGIVGFDDIPMSSWPPYRLSSVAQPVEGLVREVVGLIERPDVDDGATCLLLPGHFVSRRSLRGEDR